MRFVSAILLSALLLVSGFALADDVQVEFSFTLPEGWAAVEGAEGEFVFGDVSHLNVQVSDGTGMTMDLIAESGDAYHSMFESYGATGIQIAGLAEFGENLFFVMEYVLSGTTFHQALILFEENLFTLTFTDLADQAAFELILSTFAA